MSDVLTIDIAQPEQMIADVLRHIFVRTGRRVLGLDAKWMDSTVFDSTVYPDFKVANIEIRSISGVDWVKP